MATDDVDITIKVKGQKAKLVVNAARRLGVEPQDLLADGNVNSIAQDEIGNTVSELCRRVRRGDTDYPAALVALSTEYTTEAAAGAAASTPVSGMPT